MFPWHLRVVHGNMINLEILSYYIIQRLRLYLLYFSHLHCPRWLNIACMFSTAGRKGERNGMPTPFKGHSPEAVYITFKNISLVRILLHGHYLNPKETGTFVLILKDHTYTDKFKVSISMCEWVMEEKQ